MTCRDAARLVSESCERPLSPGEKLKLKILCILCHYTARYEQQVALLHEKVCDHREEISEQASVELSTECKARLKAKLAETN